MDDRQRSSTSGPEADRRQRDPYTRRPGYATGVDGRTDTWTTSVVAGVVAGFVISFVAGLLGLAEPIAFAAAVVVGAAVWFTLRTLRRAAGRRAGRDEAFAKARSQAVADANGGRRFFVAPNPVVVIVMGGIFLALGAWRLVAAGPSAGSIVVSVLLGVSAVVLVVQGIGTLVLQRRGA